MTGIGPKNMPNEDVETGVTPANPVDLNENAPLLSDEKNVNNYLGPPPDEDQYDDDGTDPRLLHQGAPTRSPSTMSVTSHQEEAEKAPARPWWDTVWDITRRVLAPAEEKRDEIDVTTPPNAPVEECDCDLDHASINVPSTAGPIAANFFSSISSEEGDHMTDEKVTGTGAR